MYIIILFIYLCRLLTQAEGWLRIVGGVEVPAGFGKFHASLQNITGHHICGGAIISHRHIATAAHCVVGAKTRYIRVVVGTTDLDVNGLEYDVKSIYIHEEYNSSLKINDIAIIRINGLFDLAKVEILRLDNRELKENDTVLLTGFGAHEVMSDDKVNLPTYIRPYKTKRLMVPHGESSRKMHALNLTVFSQNTCQFAMRYTRKVYDSMFCTFTMIGQGSCHGDSGGPLTRENKLIGLVSWGIPCAVGFPDVHTRISSYVLWIKRIIDKNVCSYCHPKTLKAIIKYKSKKKRMIYAKKTSFMNK